MTEFVLTSNSGDCLHPESSIWKVHRGMASKGTGYTAESNDSPLTAELVT